MATLEQALAKLRSDPVSFLKHHHVRVLPHPNAGVTLSWFGGVQGDNNARGEADYLRTARPDDVLGTLRMHNSKVFRFIPDRARLWGSPVGVQTWYVAVTRSATIVQNQIPSLAVSRTNGPDIMITMLLSGCTFVFEPTLHSVLMAHVEPPAGQPEGAGARLETAIMNSYSLTGGQGVGEALAFGAGRCYSAEAQDVSIIGVRSQQQWRLFAQYHAARLSNQTVRVVEFFKG